MNFKLGLNLDSCFYIHDLEFGNFYREQNRLGFGSSVNLSLL